MPFLTAVEALPSLESMKFPIVSVLSGNLDFRDEFAQDCLLQRRVRNEPAAAADLVPSLESNFTTFHSPRDFRVAGLGSLAEPVS
jgi:hypothetical protein